MLEIALSFSAFLLLTVGVMEFAMAVYAYNFCSYASGQAARWAAVRGSQYSNSFDPPIALLTTGDIRSYVLSQMVALDPSKLNVQAVWFSPASAATPDNNHDPGSNVQVTVTYTVVPLAGLALTHNIDVHNTSQTFIVH